MTAAIAYILFAVAIGDSPDLTALADFPNHDACETAATAIKSTLATGENGKLLICIGSDALGGLAKNSAAN